MSILLVAFLTGLASAETQHEPHLEVTQVPTQKSFNEKLTEGSELLKNVPNVDDTKEFLEKLHSMENEIRKELILSPERKDELVLGMKDYVDVREDQANSLGETILEVNKHSKVDTALFQGDIILTKQQAAEIIEDIHENHDNRTKRQAFRGKTNAARRVFVKAAALWAWDTCINFGESYPAADKILVIESVGCWSHIGRIGGTQALSLGAGCESVGTAAHEIGHALGLFHTQSRYDRDDFITIDLFNLQVGWDTQFVKQTQETNYNYNITYDYGSVMHYGAASVAANGQPCMVPRDIKYTQTLGSPFISFYEKLMINLHYNCTDICKDSKTSCYNGGFPHPRQCSRCICPSGYGGELCDEKPSGCGTIVEATDSYQILNDTIGRWNFNPQDDNDEFYKCFYWIQGPPGSTIEVVFDNYTENLAYDGCVFAGVEIKTLADKRLTGYRFCSSKYSGTTLISTHNIVPIITWSRVYRANTILRYRLSSPGTNTKKSTSKAAEPERRTTLSVIQSSTNPVTHCNDRILCEILVNLNMCHRAELSDELKERVCPGFCRK
ncbi:astacin [Dictyocaulus viviparus]|uniref:Zinc metalloproteinase n=1 Tax=Dictyocaulus viviparus TaxID=29172 RepID=A0A0D8Y1U2_DICVI|nr:astacin [Dictyocaulus viviparus]